MLPEGFVYIKDVIPSVREDIRYAGTHNFMGRPADGYAQPLVVASVEVARALVGAADALRRRSHIVQKEGIMQLIGAGMQKGLRLLRGRDSPLHQKLMQHRAHALRPFKPAPLSRPLHKAQHEYSPFPGTWNQRNQEPAVLSIPD